MNIDKIKEDKKKHCKIMFNSLLEKKEIIPQFNQDVPCVFTLYFINGLKIAREVAEIKSESTVNFRDADNNVRNFSFDNFDELVSKIVRKRDDYWQDKISKQEWIENQTDIETFKDWYWEI